MTRDEFTMWGDDFRGLFPGPGKWLAEPAQKHLRDTAFDALFSKISLGLCLQVNKGMSIGTIERFDQNEWDGILRHVAGHAMRIAANAERRKNAAQQLEMEKWAGEANMASCYQKLRQASSEEERIKILGMIE